MPRRASLKGKGAEIFYPNGEKEGDEDHAEPASSAAAPPTEAAAAKKPTTRRKRRTRKPKAQPPTDDVTAKAPPVKTLATVVADTPSPATPVAKTPAPVRSALPPPPPATRVVPSPATPRAAPPPATPRATSLARPPEPAELTTSARYDYLAGEIDALYDVAGRKIAAGRGVGQSMQWLSDARRLVMTGKAADFAEAELLVKQVSGILKHGDEIDKLYARVLEEVGDSPKLTEQCMDLLHQARKKIIAGELGDLIGAEFLMEEVKGILVQVRKSRASSRTPSTILLWFWLMGWLLAFLGLFIADKPLAEMLYYDLGLAPSGSLPPSSLAQYMLPWLCLVWGAVGSLFDTLVAINKHMANRTYDGHYIAQGFASPMYGALLGTLMYFLFTGGLVAVGTGVAFSSVGGTSSAADVQVTATTAARSLALWVIAFLSGFFHNRTINLLGKIFDQILITMKIIPEPKEEPPQPPSPPVEPSVTPPAVPPATKPPPPPAVPPVTPPPPPPATPPATPPGPPGPPDGPPPGVLDVGDI